MTEIDVLAGSGEHRRRPRAARFRPPRWQLHRPPTAHDGAAFQFDSKGLGDSLGPWSRSRRPDRETRARRFTWRATKPSRNRPRAPHAWPFAGNKLTLVRSFRSRASLRRPEPLFPNRVAEGCDGLW